MSTSTSPLVVPRKQGTDTRSSSTTSAACPRRWIWRRTTATGAAKSSTKRLLYGRPISGGRPSRSRLKSQFSRSRSTAGFGWTPTRPTTAGPSDSGTRVAQPSSDSDPPHLRQCERDKRAARRPTGSYIRASGRTGAVSTVAAKRRDHDELFAVHLIRDRGCVAGVYHHRLPQQLASILIEGPKFPVEVRGTDEDQPAGSHDGAAIILGTRVLQTLLGEFRILTERNLPGVFSRIQIDRIQRPPGRRHRGIAVGVVPLMVPGEVVFQVGG